MAAELRLCPVTWDDLSLIEDAIFGAQNELFAVYGCTLEDLRRASLKHAGRFATPGVPPAMRVLMLRLSDRHPDHPPAVLEPARLMPVTLSRCAAFGAMEPVDACGRPYDELDMAIEDE